MKIKECAYFWSEKEECNLFPYKSKVELFFLCCEAIPISKCPYKLYVNKKIDKEELNKQIRNILI